MGEVLGVLRQLLEAVQGLRSEFHELREDLGVLKAYLPEPDSLSGKALAWRGRRQHGG